MCLYNYLTGTVLQVAMCLVTSILNWIIPPLVLHVSFSVTVLQVSKGMSHIINYSKLNINWEHFIWAAAVFL